MQRAPINSLDRVKSAWEVDEGGRGMMASSLVLLFSRSIEVGEKLGVGGSMLSHISPLMFSRKVLCFSCSLALQRLLIKKGTMCKCLSFDLLSCLTCSYLMSESIRSFHGDGLVYPQQRCPAA